MNSPLSKRILDVDRLLGTIIVSGDSVISMAQARIQLKQIYDTVSAEETLKKMAQNGSVDTLKPQEEIGNG